MSKRNLLICFDAFGTLFTPKRAVHLQYAEVAESLGLGPFSESSVKSSFKEAYKKESAQNPNFGKANGMNAEQWWTNIIRNTFRPLIGSEKQLPKDLVPRLLHRFWSEEGYKLMPDVQQLFQQLQRRSKERRDGSLVVGVVTNSDDRVPDILTSLRLRVGAARYGSKIGIQATKEQFDIDFTVMSFDVGHEKPDRRIFDAAERMAADVRDQCKIDDLESWQKIYVGDDHQKDVRGALDAGWNAVLIAPYTDASQYDDVRWLDDRPAGNVLEEFTKVPAVGFSRLGKLVEWLPKAPSAL